jgi:hypothetical protein
MMNRLSFTLPHWNTPVYKFQNKQGEEILIDVTTSVSSGLGPSHVLKDSVIPIFKKHNVDKVLDFGAGALRHTIPLLNAGFKVGAIDFKEGYSREICKGNLGKICKNDRFCLLEWPHTYCGNRDIFKGKFDAALLVYVLQTMPEPKERNDALKYISLKLKKQQVFLFYCARFNQLKDENTKYQVSDGYYMYPNRKLHSFYREFTTPATHSFMEDYKFRRIRSLSERGTNQMFLYFKGKYP